MRQERADACLRGHPCTSTLPENRMKTILIIDDDDALRQILRLSLVQLGYAVHQASNGKIGLRMYGEQRIDLVITDLLMPEKDGFEIIMDLRKIDPTVKIIVMSGGARLRSEEILPIAKQLGAALTLNKPFSFDELRVAVSYILGNTPDLEVD